MERKNDFSVGSVPKTITKLAVPMIVAQLINVLYNIVDRVYVGHIPVVGTVALTGLGLAFPIITLITAFTNMCGDGGAPLCSISRGAGDNEKAEKIIGSAFFMLIFFGVLVMAVGFIFKREILVAFGASGDTLPYADKYITIYLIGTLFSMVGLGMNSFISCQGFSGMSMITICVGAVLNIILDPVFIYVLNMGVQGAALATVISQFCSMLWVLRFLTGKKAILKLKLKYIQPDFPLCGRILSLGLANFVMSVTSCAVQVAANKALSIHGGDLFVGIMTIITSINEFALNYVKGMGSGCMPVTSYNYGAKKYGRVVEGARFLTIVSLVYAALITAVTLSAPRFLMGLFSDSTALMDLGEKAVRIYFCTYFMMAFQMAGQTMFTSLGMSKHAICFSLLRKAVIVLPLTIILPGMGLGSWGVFWAEPISCIIGGLACYTTMYFTVIRRMKKLEKGEICLHE